MAVAWNPVDYSRSSGAQQAWARELIGKLGLRGDESVLDIGCGDGELLNRLIASKQVKGLGLELSQGNIVNCVRRGVPVVQGNIDEGMRAIPDKSYEYVILSMTLQVIRDPVLALNEMLRVGKKCIVSFPNFGFWKVRAKTLLLGKAPVTRNLPYSWYLSPNRHVLSILDFREYCRRYGIRIEQEIPLSSRGYSLPARRWPNIFADEALFVISSQELR